MTVNEGDSEDNIEEVEESMDWLAANEVPWDLVLLHWKKTSKIRCKELKDTQNKNLVNIFQTWKLYGHVQGYDLIDIDFKHLNLTKIELSIEAWNRFFDTVKIKINERDGTATNLDKKLRSTENTNSKVLIGLALISHMYPSKQMKKIEGKSHRPSIGLTKESMFKIAETPGDMQRVKQTAKALALAQKLSIQPYILVVGSLEEVEDVYVCIDEKLYKVNSILQALDICFKAFHVFDLQYPVSSEHVWLMIQKGIYKINLQYDPVISSIQHVLKKLNVEENQAT